MARLKLLLQNACFLISTVFVSGDINLKEEVPLWNKILFKQVAVFQQYGLSIQSLIETSLLNLPNLPGVRVVGTFQSFYSERIIIVCFFTVCEH